MQKEIKIRVPIVDDADEAVQFELNDLNEVTITQGLNGRYAGIYGLTIEQLETVTRKLRALKEAA